MGVNISVSIKFRHLYFLLRVVHIHMGYKQCELKTLVINMYMEGVAMIWLHLHYTSEEFWVNFKKNFGLPLYDPISKA